MVGKFMNSILRYFGLEIARKKYVSSNRGTLQGALENIKMMGFQPETVIDVGAATGTFELYDIFPQARRVLIDPLEENRPFLEAIVKRYKNSEYLIAAAYKSGGSVTINVHPDLDGSSLHLEREDSGVNGRPRAVKAVTLDDLSQEYRLCGPYLIKIDVQGAEIDVLKGALRILPDAEYIILEVLLFKFFEGGAQIYDVINFMKEHCFVVYDIFNYTYRPLDGAMSQVDVVFVKESGRFRKHHFFATRRQREKQNSEYIKYRREAQIRLNTYGQL